MLQRGGWSSAYAFDSNGREFILRLGAHGEDFAKEWVVSCWHTPGVPIPEAINRQHVVELTRHHFPDENLELLRLYELHIGAASLQYMAFADDRIGLESTTDRIMRMLKSNES